MAAAYTWFPSERGDHLHAVAAGHCVAGGLAVTACSPTAPMALSPDAAGPDFDRCSHCVRAIGSGGVAVCGTYSGYSRHKKRREQPCEPCRVANAEYLREWRSRNPSSAARTRSQVAARSRAMTRLASEFPERFQALYEEELLRDEGISLPDSTGHGGR